MPSAARIECRLHFATEFVHDSDQAFAAARSIAEADLFLLATPLYVDSFPSLATRALELVEAARRTERRDAVFVPLVNCGFPEPEHTRTALHIARNFARAAGYGYAGALPLGAGGVVTAERSLEEPRPPVSHVVRAIELTAPALAAGGPVPEAALRAISRRSSPNFSIASPESSASAANPTGSERTSATFELLPSAPHADLRGSRHCRS